MDNFVFVALILIPGAFIKQKIDNHIPGSRKVKSQIEEIIDLFKFGIIANFIFFIVTYVLKMYFSIFKIETLDVFLMNLRNIYFLALYIIIMIIIINIVGALYSNDRFCKFILKNKNATRVKNNSLEVTQYNTVWDEIFENPKAIPSESVLEIYKGGFLVTRGELEIHSSPNSGKNELKLVNTNEINAWFKYDEGVEEEKKGYNKILFEYYDIDNDLLIKFYDSLRKTE